ncbi:MAG TPA: putative PEP-binding protein [Acidimicrobiales bacterium]
MSGDRGAARIRAVVARGLDPADAFTPDDAVRAVTAEDLELVLHPQGSGGVGPVLAVGIGASPGSASGAAVFDTWRALDLVDEGIPVILVRPETAPADEPAMAMAEGILTSGGGMTSHAAVVARGRGLPAVCGAAGLTIGEDALTTVDGRVVAEGEVISIDGSTGQVRLGETVVDAGEVPPEMTTLLAWADDARAGGLAVLANADTPEDAARALAFGAEGIGLCRTEHLFLGADRLPLVQEVILADGSAAETAALDALEVVQRADFAALLEVMDGRPVTVRLLDPPLHEFLPDLTDLVVAESQRALTPAEDALLAAARRWREHNPMLGVRGVRLAVLKPGLYRMQARALFEAALAHLDGGGRAEVRVLIPLVSTRAELALVRGWVVEEAEALVRDRPPGSPELTFAVGAMVETPRAALRAGELAEQADFLSLGTNDLTQMTYGFSRDDVGRILERYLADGLLAADPFETLDPDGVGELVAMTVERAQAVRPGVAVGVCGEHGGDPASIRLFHRAGLRSVSCSPFRVPVARLAAAQAALEGPSPV